MLYSASYSLLLTINYPRTIGVTAGSQWQDVGLSTEAVLMCTDAGGLDAEGLHRLGE